MKRTRVKQLRKVLWYWRGRTFGELPQWAQRLVEPYL